MEWIGVEWNGMGCEVTCLHAVWWAQDATWRHDVEVEAIVADSSDVLRKRNAWSKGVARLCSEVVMVVQ